MLTKEQKDMCEKRLYEHQHKDYHVDIELLPDFKLTHFLVKKGVLRPEKTSGFYFARYLAKNKQIYKSKAVLDLGCGSGIQGIVCGLLGAKSVMFSDISQIAIENSKNNAAHFGISDKAKFSCGDLFENINEKFDTIIFNHPFFASTPDPKHPITRAWFDDGELLQKFLNEVDSLLNQGGEIILPYFPFAGETNNPMTQGNKKGFDVKEIHVENVDDRNLQKGEFKVFRLQKLTDRQ